MDIKYECVQLKRSEPVRFREEYQDRGERVPLLTDYMAANNERLHKYFWLKFTGEGLRDKLDWCLSWAMSFRGETSREAELADLFSLELDGEGAQTLTLLLIQMRRGKTHPPGDVVVSGALRHKDVWVGTHYSLKPMLTILTVC
jgi:hypothetical protein